MIEVLKMTLLFNIHLNKFEYVSPHSLHGFDHVIISSLLDSIANALRIQFVNSNQICKNLTEICEILLANTGSNFLIYLDDEINGLYDIRSHKLIGAHVGSLKDGEPVLVGVLEKLVYVVGLELRLSGDHVADTFIDHELLLFFKITAVFGDQADKGEDIGLLTRFNVHGEHVLRKF